MVRFGHGVPDVLVQISYCVVSPLLLSLLSKSHSLIDDSKVTGKGRALRVTLVRASTGSSEPDSDSDSAPSSCPSGWKCLDPEAENKTGRSGLKPTDPTASVKVRRGRGSASSGETRSDVCFFVVRTAVCGEL